MQAENKKGPIEIGPFIFKIQYPMKNQYLYYQIIVHTSLNGTEAPSGHQTQFSGEIFAQPGQQRTLPKSVLHNTSSPRVALSKKLLSVSTIVLLCG